MVAGAPAARNTPITKRTSSNPTVSGSQRICEKNRRARDQWTRSANPAATHIPVTVRGPTAPNAPTTSATNVVNPGAPNAPRHACNTSNRPGGTVSIGSIDETA
jgi:hypothetical protein